ncbi:MAG: type II toxin-antitoxin system VapC family toxin [Chloroflexota bacterium]
MAFVVDNSVAMAWCFDDEANAYTESVLDRLRREEAVVPSIWPLEAANVLLLAERRQRISEAQLSHFVTILRSLPITVSEIRLEAATGPVLSLARSHRLTAYDAAYLELAMREVLPPATQDHDLAAAARRVGVPLVE